MRIKLTTIIIVFKAIFMKMKFKMFRGLFASWDTLFTHASEFATKIGKDRVINISHSNSRRDGVVTVWYWSDE